MQMANWGGISEEPYENGEPGWNQQKSYMQTAGTGMKPANWGETSKEPYENSKEPYENSKLGDA